MDRRSYDDYLQKFNSHDYEGVLEYFAPKFEVQFAGYCLSSREEVLRFYTFLHTYMRETIFVDRYLSDDYTVALEARVRLEGLKELTPEAAAAAGFGQLAAPRVGRVIEIPQFIHYHLERGKFVKALCAVLA